MDKVLIIISDNNKGKFMAKGFSSAFKNLSYFIVERKIYDLNISEVNHIKPRIIFILWTDMTQKDILNDFLENYEGNAVIFHCAELSEEIPPVYKKRKKHHIFAQDSKNKFLPSVNAEEYKAKFVKYKYGITFAGNPLSGDREELLCRLIMNFGAINIFCRSYDFYKSVDEISRRGFAGDYFLELYRSSYRGYVESAKELADIYASSEINIDLKSENEKYLNYRCLEIMAAGGFLIAPYNKEALKYFDDGKDFESYSNIDDLTDKIKFYLKNKNIARQIALNGKINTTNNHSFCDRLKSMLEVVYGKNLSNR